MFFVFIQKRPGLPVRLGDLGPRPFLQVSVSLCLCIDDFYNLLACLSSCASKSTITLIKFSLCYPVGQVYVDPVDQ